MLIPIRLGGSQQQHDNGANSPEEWSLIELNGTLSSAPLSSGITSQATNVEAGLGGLPLGQLSFAAPDKVGVVDDDE